MLPLYYSERRLNAPDGHVALTSDDVLLADRQPAQYARNGVNTGNLSIHRSHSIKSHENNDLAVDDDFLHRDHMPPGAMDTIPMHDRGRRERETVERASMSILIVLHIVGAILSATLSDGDLATTSFVSIIFWVCTLGTI